LTVTTMALLGFVPGVAQAGDQQHPQGSPGAPGIGDPYFPLDGNGGYDVAHYDLDVTYDPATDFLTAVARIRATATQNLSSFNLDFEGLEIRSITVRSDGGDDRGDGEEATWTRDGGELTVTPAHVLRRGHEFTTVVRYDGVPETLSDPLIGPSGFIHTDDGAIVAGQPDVAATWFPANDHPRDAASVSVTATVPEGLEAISNGVLEDSSTRDGWTTWAWDAEEPMATYLVTLAIGEFDVRAYEKGGIEYWDALDPDLFGIDLIPEEPGPTAGEIAESSFGRQPEIIDFLSGVFGDYPFEAAGGIVDDYPELFFALETQTRPIYSMLFFTDQLSGDDVVVHELAHQWTGDLLRLDSWQHIWLNEGFATYAEWLWLEREGLATAQQIFDDLSGIPADDPFWDVLTGDPGPADLFDYEAVYLRGAMTLHALRLAVGDEVFFDILEEWVASQAGESVTTDEFIAVAEKVSGMQLDELFDAWLFTPGKPAGLPDAPAAGAASAARQLAVADRGSSLRR
jgi:aminopeptidase N